jgi:galactokinase
MDQFISCCGNAQTALMLDCRSLEHRLLPIPSHIRLVICNTMVKHELAASEYNTRRVECEAAVRYFASRLPGVRALRDVTLDDLPSFEGDLSDELMSRSRHVVSENGRVAEAASALEVGDLEALGRLMAESHRSLRYDYQVSCEELDVMVELASQVDGAYGSRMTGGGFGGCTINLVSADRVEQFKESITRGYQQVSGILPEIIVCSAADGAAPNIDSAT